MSGASAWSRSDDAASYVDHRPAGVDGRVGHNPVDLVAEHLHGLMEPADHALAEAQLIGLEREAERPELLRPGGQSVEEPEGARQPALGPQQRRIAGRV